MSSPQTSDPPVPCTWQPDSICQGCPTDGKLMCRFDRLDLVNFLMIFLPFGVTAIAGTLRAGYGRFLWAWLAYALFFFFIWEARVLCRHCPYWAETGSVLHCHANYGVVKIWKYRPGPMSRWEKTQFALGALLLIGFPFPFLWAGHEGLLALIALSTVVSGGFILWKNVCSRCIHFSCPANAVPKPLVDAYLRQNPDIRAAWESEGYRLEPS